LFICGCGVGELLGWARPLLEALQRGGRDWEVSLVLWPRLFLSGLEADLARGLPGVARVYPPASALRLLAPGGVSRDGGGRALVLHMGGGAALSLRLGRKLGAPVHAYAEQPGSLPRGFALRYGTEASRRDGAGEILGLGNMLVDSVADIRRARQQAVEKGCVVGLLPGSRPVQLRHGLPLVGPLAEAVALRVPDVRFVIGRSPLLSDRMLQRVLAPDDPASLQCRHGDCVLRTGGGLRIPLQTREQVLSRSRVLVSSPGTNTGEAAALGIPHLVVAPFDPRQPLFTGIPGMIERIPGSAGALRRLLLRRLAGSVRYYAQANLRAGREVVPELQGALDAACIAERLTALLQDEEGRERMSRELTAIMGPPGAAERLARALEQWHRAF
jgi:hypothetical protein